MACPRFLWLGVLWLSLPAVGLAHSVSEEVSLSTTQQAQQNPRTGAFANTVTGVIDASEAVSVTVDLGFTHDNGTRTQVGTETGYSPGGNILLGAVALDWMPSEHWMFGGAVDVSPRSVTTSRTTVLVEDTATGQQTEADAELRTVSSVWGVSLSGGYATAGLSDFEGAVDASAALTRFSVTPSLTRLETRLGPLSADQIRAFCSRPQLSRANRALCTTLLAALRGEPATLEQLRLSLSFTGTLSQDTDVGLVASLYAYDRDPTSVGYFSVLAVGRTVTVGNGIPLAPVQFSVRPLLVHRFGKLSLDGAYQFGRYVDDQGAFHAFSARAQYRFNKAWRAWLRLSAQVDLDADGRPLRSSAVTAGVRYTF